MTTHAPKNCRPHLAFDATECNNADMPYLWCCTRLLSPDHDLDVYADGLRVGRVYRTTLDGSSEQWLWVMQLKQQKTGVQYSGQGETLEDAMIAFEANYSQASAPL